MDESKVRDGGPVYPVEMYGPGRPVQTGPSTYIHPGMSLRDWFAGQALVGAIAASGIVDGTFPPPEGVARVAYCMADAMLAEREKRQ